MFSKNNIPADLSSVHMDVKQSPVGRKISYLSKQKQSEKETSASEDTEGIQSYHGAEQGIPPCTKIQPFQKAQKVRNVLMGEKHAPV